ncbi:MAG TPA: glycine betaine ABC transporter substrate-binding protein [Ilumatobacteraceae bacterium]|nr:glycine betaine ABC transporter substrate-binding protein [Ilumatobacteraceae bacterium]
MKFKALKVTAAIAIAASSLVACGSDSDTKSGDAASSCGELKGDAITIVRNAWTASAIEAEITKQLIESQLCVPAEIVDIDENSMFTGLSDGSVDFVSELWPSGVVADEQAFIDDGSVVDMGPLGTTGQIGWFVPDYVVTEHPTVATWEGLKDPAVAQLFATAATGDKGRFLGTDPSYSQLDAPLVANLGLPFDVVFSGSEAATVAELDSAVAAKKPILMYWWTPTAAAGKYHLVQVQLPEYTAGCADDTAKAACGYPADPLKKLASAKLQAKNAKVWAMVQKLTITNDQQLELLPQVEIDQKPAADVAKAWIAANEPVWKAWFA